MYESTCIMIMYIYTICTCVIMHVSHVSLMILIVMIIMMKCIVINIINTTIIIIIIIIIMTLKLMSQSFKFETIKVVYTYNSISSSIDVISNLCILCLCRCFLCSMFFFEVLDFFVFLSTYPPYKKKKKQLAKR